MLFEDIPYDIHPFLRLRKIADTHKAFLHLVAK